MELKKKPYARRRELHRNPTKQILNKWNENTDRQTHSTWLWHWGKSERKIVFFQMRRRRRGEHKKNYNRNIEQWNETSVYAGVYWLMAGERFTNCHAVNVHRLPRSAARCDTAHGCGIRALISFRVRCMNSTIYLNVCSCTCAHEHRHFIIVNTEILKRFVCCMWRGYGLSRTMMICNSNNDIAAHLFEINSVFALRHLLSQLGTAPQHRNEKTTKIKTWNRSMAFKSKFKKRIVFILAIVERRRGVLICVIFHCCFVLLFFRICWLIFMAEILVVPVDPSIATPTNSMASTSSLRCTRNMYTKLQCATQSIEIR